MAKCLAVGVPCAGVQVSALASITVPKIVQVEPVKVVPDVVTLPWKLDHPDRSSGHRYLTVARVRSTFMSRERLMSHAEHASKSLAVLMKLAVMLRIVRLVQFVFDKFSALLRSKERDEMLAGGSLGEASRITRSAVVQQAAVLQPSSDHAIAVPKTNDQPDREQLIRHRWLETGIKMWNPDHHGAGHAALNIQGRAELLPPKPGETLPGYDMLEFKIVRSCVNGQEVNHIVCEGVVVDPPKRRAERLTTGAAVT